MGNDNRNKAATRTQNPAAAKVAKPTAEGAPKNLGEARLRVMAAVPYIRKRGTMAGGGNYKYVRDTDVIAALRGPMLENLIILTGPHEIRNTGSDTIATSRGTMNRTMAEYLFKLEFVPTGESSPVWAKGEGADNLDKSCNKSMSAARKYALLLGFNVTTGDDPDQFDQDGHFGGPSQDEDDHTGQQPPEQSKPTTVKNDKPKTEPKREEKKEEPKAGSHLPASGKELHERLTDYGAKLAKSGVCGADELVAHVTQTGVKAGYPADMNLWEAVAISAAVEWVKTFEAEKRAAKAEPKPEPKPEPKKEEPKAEPTKPDDKFNVLKNSGTASEADKPAPAPTQPAPAQAPAQTGPTAAERYAKRVAGMNASTKKENLDAFRAKYSEDKEMTKDQIAELEKVYWKNVERVTGKKLAETART